MFQVNPDKLMYSLANSFLDKTFIDIWLLSFLFFFINKDLAAHLLKLDIALEFQKLETSNWRSR